MRHHPHAPRINVAAPVPTGDSLTASVQPYLEHVLGGGAQESANVARAWELYEMPEVRSAARQYSSAFSSAKLVLGRREEVGKDPTIVTEAANPAEERALEIVRTFAGGPTGQTEFMDRMGTYFIVPGEMIAVGALDPAHIADSKFAKWDLFSTTEVRWDGQKVHVQTEPIEDRFQEMPDYIKHIRIWNRHPRRAWQPDSPVLSALGVLELINVYDDRLMAEGLSRLIGAGVWMIPQGLSLPTSTGDPSGGTPQDFLRLLMEVAKLAIKDRRSAAAMVPILVEAASEDIQAAKDGLIDFSSQFDERVGELQEKAIRRWATGVDLPAENMLGMSSATHWNASLISEDKVQSFIIPSLRRAVGSLTWGVMKPALREFDQDPTGLEFWFDPSGIKTRVDLADEAKWGNENFLVNDPDTLYAMGLDPTKVPTNDELKRMMLLHMAKSDPASVPAVLKELGITVSKDLLDYSSEKTTGEDNAGDEPPAGDGRSGPQQANAGDTAPSSNGAGRTARLSTSTT